MNPFAPIYNLIFDDLNYLLYLSATITPIVGLFMVYWGYAFAKRQFRLIRTASYIERYTSPAFLKIRLVVDKHLYGTWQKPLDAQLKDYEALLSDETETALKLRHRLWTLAMLFNEIGLAYRTGAIDDTSMENFNRLLPRYWHRLKPYIWAMNKRFATAPPYKLKNGFLQLEDVQQLILFNNFKLGYLRLRKTGNAIEPNDLFHPSAIIALPEELVHSPAIIELPDPSFENEGSGI